MTEDGGDPRGGDQDVDEDVVEMAEEPLEYPILANFRQAVGADHRYTFSNLRSAQANRIGVQGAQHLFLRLAVRSINGVGRRHVGILGSPEEIGTIRRKGQAVQEAGNDSQVYCVQPTVLTSSIRDHVCMRMMIPRMG